MAPAGQRRLIVNADDFGLTDGVSSGIVHCLRAGIVTSTSALVCDPAAPQRLDQWREALQGRAGVHLQMTDGRPLSDPASVASLLTPQGIFPRFPDAIGQFDTDELRREWHAQVATFLDSGLAPTHMDTHHHVHSHPVIFGVYREIATAYGLPARTLSAEMTRQLRSGGVPCACLSAEWKAGDQQSLLDLVSRLFTALAGDSVVEIGCHPARIDAELERLSVYASPRARELEVLCTLSLRRELADRGIQLVPARALSL